MTQKLINATHCGAFILFSSLICAQAPIYENYLGAGNAQGIVVSTSSDLSQNGWQRSASGVRTLDGGGLDARMMEASRFLAQAGNGGNLSEIQTLSESLDFEGWIDWQAELPKYSILDATYDALETARSIAGQSGGNPNAMALHPKHFHAGLWQSMLHQPDILRHKVALALSEIMVISTTSDIGSNADAYAHYYDVLRKHAFGNFKELLFEVSIHPAMGVYLTHFRNAKTSTENNTFPDENYAREIMQLFTIGLYELNIDGNWKLDNNGDPIAAYGQNDIRALAQVFTGLGAGGVNEEALADNRPVDWTVRRAALSYQHFMQMYEEEHEPGIKVVLGHSIAAGSGMEEIELAIEMLTNHPNTPPFFCKKLIQLLVSSNPSPAYISDVAKVFVDNGSGERGDMLAVIKAILLHDEARTCEAQNMPTHGRLRAPAQRYLHFAKSIQLDLYQSLSWPHQGLFQSSTGHMPFSSPSVFNFYLPDFQANGPIADAGLLSPEFEVHNSTTAIGFFNELDGWTRTKKIFKSEDLPAFASVDYAAYFPASTDPDVILNHLDIMLTHGRLKESTRAAIKQAFNAYNPNQTIAIPIEDRLDMAIFLTMLSADYAILK
jgi:uncharacterized protein (DUF1800 family)